MAFPKSKGRLGFQDLELFNDAMLAMQAWQLLDNTQSLCVRVLKGHYYPHGEFQTVHQHGELSSVRETYFRKVLLGELGTTWKKKYLDCWDQHHETDGRLKENSFQLVTDLIQEEIG